MFDSIEGQTHIMELTPLQKKIFGFKLFHNRELDFSPSLNMPPTNPYGGWWWRSLLIDNLMVRHTVL